jgi:hypothetical protein
MMTWPGLQPIQSDDDADAMDSEASRQWVGCVSECEDEARERVCCPVGSAALPDALAGGEAGDGEVGVEVLSQLGDHPIRAHGPGVHPVHTGGDPPLVGGRSLGDDGGSEGVHGARHEAEAVVGSSSGEHAHHVVLVLGRAMEPPLQVGGEEGLHGGVVAAVERLVQPEHQELVALLLGLGLGPSCCC